MRTMIAAAALSVALTGISILPATAQTIDRAAVVAACSGANASAASCNAAVARFVAAAKTLPPNQADALLADLVVALASTGNPSPAIREIVAAAVTTVAQEFADPRRTTTALQIADAVELGQPLDPSVTQTLASPS